LPAAVAVRVVMVGTVEALILSVLVAVALLNAVIVPEFARLTIPAALFVMPAIVPELFRLIVPVLVKFARRVEIAPDPVTPIVPALASVVTEEVPPMFNVLPTLLVRVLDPASAVDTVKVPLFVVVPLMVRLGIATALAPLIVLPVPVNV